MAKLKMSVTQKLAEEIVTAKFEDLPLATVDRVKRAVMDDVGCAFMGYQVIDKPLVHFTKNIGGVPESTIIADGTKVSCGLAGGVNADMAGNSNFFEASTGAGVHVLSPIVETAIAVGECVGASGRDVITAVELAYEFSGRFASNLKDERPAWHFYPFHYRRHQNLIVAICAAKLLGLNEEKVNRAIGMAWMFTPPSPGLLTKTDWWREVNIWTVQLGVQAALLAQYLPDGPRDMLDEDGDEIYHLDRLTKSPSPHYYVVNVLGLKPWLGSYGFMGGIEAAKSIVEEENLKPEDIEKILFRGPEVYANVDRYSTTEPKNYLKSQRLIDYLSVASSIPWSLACVILGYESVLDWVAEERFTDKAAISLAKKVKIEGVGDYRINEVEITTKTSTYKRRIMRLDFLGGPKRPMSKEQAEGKFLSLVHPVVGDKQAREMVEIFTNLEQLDNIKDLTKLYA